MNNKGLLVISFGTSYKETRAKTLDRIEKDLAAAFPDRILYGAWSSRFIIKKLLKEGIKIDTPEEALEKMLSDGITDALVQPTCVAEGEEYRRILAGLKEYEDKFERLRVGRPLLDTDPDRLSVVHSLKDLYPQVTSSDRLVLMGHGVPDENNAPGGNDAYHKMNLCLAKEVPNSYLALVEAKPGLEEARAWLKENPPEEGGKVYLVPFLLVAGDHANNDLAGDGEDSWRSVLKRDGHDVVCVIKGLGEFDGIRQHYVRHAKEAE